MFYIVFTEYDRVKRPSGEYFKPLPVCRYVGRFKESALREFKAHIDFAFSTSSPYPGRTYFAGFDTDLDFIKTFEEKDIKVPQEDVTQNDILLFKSKLDVAICSHVLNHSCHKFTKSIINTKCSHCDTETTLHKNAFGEYLCVDCWNSYLTTVNSQVEYVIGLAFGEYKIGAFSESDRDTLVEAWKEHKYQLGKTEAELQAIEAAAREAGLSLETLEE
jgi:hypothetical protein